MGILVKTSGEITEVTPHNEKYFSLKEVQEYVGGYVELFRVGNKQYLFNEEGTLLDLPYNQVATEFFAKDCKQEVVGLVGNVLILDNEQF
jgi:hypothetical protein